MSGDQVFANRMTLQIFKGKLKGAKTGYGLLKKKSDALTARFRSMLKEIYEIKVSIASDMQESNMALASAVYSAGDFKYKVRACVLA